MNESNLMEWLEIKWDDTKNTINCGRTSRMAMPRWLQNWRQHAGKDVSMSFQKSMQLQNPAAHYLVSYIQVRSTLQVRRTAYLRTAIWKTCGASRCRRQARANQFCLIGQWGVAWCAVHWSCGLFTSLWNIQRRKIVQKACSCIELLH